MIISYYMKGNVMHCIFFFLIFKSILVPFCNICTNSEQMLLIFILYTSYLFISCVTFGTNCIHFKCCHIKLAFCNQWQISPQNIKNMCSIFACEI